jgi:sterol desaturase/sphingolipid hydroxylase (fatty acid hydroxylase superfamily)
MIDGLVKQQAAVRLICFLAGFILLASWERLAPRRRLSVGKLRRWPSNLGLVGLNSLSLRVLAPLGAVGFSLFAASRRCGLFQNLELPGWLAIVLAVVLLDLTVFLQHVMFHAIPLLWRLHSVHHADLDFDVTTGLRFHTLEILLSLGIKGAAVMLIGAPVIAVIIFEVLLNATSMFNHSNVRIPLSLERYLRWIVVTPDMHRVHHSVRRRETNSNFGFNLPWWDRLLGTYRPQPLDGHVEMSIGLAEFRDEQQADRLPAMLMLPFERRAPGTSLADWSGPEEASLAGQTSAHSSPAGERPSSV